jgi:ankyrin repeat protein
MAREEKDRQQRLQAAQAASQLSFMNESSYIPGIYHHHEQQKFHHPALNNNNYFATSTPPPFEDIFSSSPYMPPTPVPPFETDPSFFVAGYPSPSLSGYVPSTPPLSIYTPSLVDEDPSNISSNNSSSSGSSNSNSNSNSNNSNNSNNNIDLDPSLYMGSTVSSSAPGPAKTQALDAFGLVPLQVMPSQSERHRSTSLPTPFSPPRSVPSLSSPGPRNARSREPSTPTPSMAHRKGSNKSLLATGININMNPSHASAHTHGKTGLHVCAEQGNTHVVQLLLGYGADIDGVDEYGRTPLHYAVLNNHADVVKQLVERGAGATIADVNGVSPVHIAAEAGADEMVQMMMPMPVSMSMAMSMSMSMPAMAGNMNPLEMSLQPGLVSGS